MRRFDSLALILIPLCLLLFPLLALSEPATEPTSSQQSPSREAVEQSLDQPVQQEESPYVFLSVSIGKRSLRMKELRGVIPDGLWSAFRSDESVTFSFRAGATPTFQFGLNYYRYLNESRENPNGLSEGLHYSCYAHVIEPIAMTRLHQSGNYSLYAGLGAGFITSEMILPNEDPARETDPKFTGHGLALRPMLEWQLRDPDGPLGLILTFSYQFTESLFATSDRNLPDIPLDFTGPSVSFGFLINLGGFSTR